MFMKRLLILFLFTALSFPFNLSIYTDKPNYTLHIEPKNMTIQINTTVFSIELEQGDYNITISNRHNTFKYHIRLYSNKELWVNEKEKTLEGFIFLILGLIIILFIIKKLKLKYNNEINLNEDKRKVLDILYKIKEIKHSDLRLKLNWHSSKLKLILSELELLGYITKEKKGDKIIIKLREEKKGQASIEYLMTYGWAVLVLSIVIVVLFAGGFLSPEGTVKEYCLFPPQITCNAFISYYWHNDIIFKMNMTNNFGYNIKITKIILRYKSVNIEKQINQNLEQGKTKIISFKFSNIKPPANRLARYEIIFYYRPCPVEFQNCEDEYKITGNILSYVMPEQK